MVVGTSQVYQMTTSKDPLKQVENPNNRVLEVRRVPDNLRQVFFDAKAPGNTTMKFVDQKDKIEICRCDRPQRPRQGDCTSRLIQPIPTAGVNVSSTDNGALILTGTVMSAEDAKTLQQLILAVGGTVINNVRVGGVQQVQIEVIVAIVDRSHARNMAFSWNAVGPNWLRSPASSAVPGGVDQRQLLSPLTPAPDHEFRSLRTDARRQPRPGHSQ